MKSTIICLSLLWGLVAASAQTVASHWFDDKNLTLTGVYYYPEHWDESQWERDFKKMHELGFEFTHLQSLLGRNWNLKKVCTTLHGWTVLLLGCQV